MREESYLYMRVKDSTDSRDLRRGLRDVHRMMSYAFMVRGLALAAGSVVRGRHRQASVEDRAPPILAPPILAKMGGVF